MKALILIDLINDIIIKRGYGEKLDENFFHRISQMTEYARKNNFLIIHVKVGFEQDYRNQPKNSPLFGKAHEFGILKLGTDGTEFYNQNDILEEDFIITKSRVNGFYDTDLENILKQNGVQEIFVGGVATELAVSSLVREAHDRDYGVNILEDICGSLDENDHKNELKILSKISKILNTQHFI